MKKMINLIPRLLPIKYRVSLSGAHSKIQVTKKLIFL